MKHLASIIRYRRIAMRFTLRSLADVSGVSPSYIGRIEQGNRFPSVHVLQKLAKPLGFNEVELLALAGFLSPIISEDPQQELNRHFLGLDLGVALFLRQEPMEIQRCVTSILMIIKNLSKTLDL